MKHSIISICLFFLVSGLYAQQQTKDKKVLGMTVAFPWINNYSYYDYGLAKSNSKSGFVGVEGSVFYKLNNNKVSLNIGLTNDLPAPMGPLDYVKEGIRTNVNSVFLEAVYHRYLCNHLNMMVGLNFIRYKYMLTSYGVRTWTNVIQDRTIGLTLGSEYCFGKSFSLGLLYKPSIVALDKKSYRHLLSLDARFDINIFKFK